MIEYILLVAGLALLVKGAELLIDGSVAMSKKLGISSLVIGLTIVALGTSTPELIVGIFAAIKGVSEISFGNIIGSNISNTLLILGISCLIRPLKVHVSTVWKEIPFSLLAAFVLFVLSNKAAINLSKNAYLTRTDGLIMLLFLVAFLYYIFSLIRQGNSQEMKIDAKPRKNITITAMITAGIAMLFVGGQWTVKGAVIVAQNLGMSQLLISSTIIAVGTSLPELFTSTVAAFKKESDLAVGNIVGSNISNIFLIMAITPIISPLAIPSSINMDFAFLILSGILLFGFMFVGRRHELERWKGIPLIAAYIVYIAFLVMRG